MTRLYQETGQRSIEILRDDAEQRIGREYPSLSYDKFILVDTSSTRLAIDDVSYKSEASMDESLEMLWLACSGEVEMYDASRLSQALAAKVDRLLEISNRRKTVVIFPGQGSQVVKDLLPPELLEGVATVEVPTQRKVDGKGAVQGVTLTDLNKLRKVCADVRPETIIVLDDVITTGATLQTIQESAPGRNIEWFAGALMTLSPLQRRGKQNGTDSGVIGFNGILSPIVYQGTTGIPALNSVSTLVGNSPKSEVVRGRYMSFVTDPEIFLESAQQIRESFGGK